MPVRRWPRRLPPRPCYRVFTLRPGILPLDFPKMTFRKAEKMTLPPNVYDAEAIPETARAEIERLLATGDLFRYTAPENAPVTLLEVKFLPQS